MTRSRQPPCVGCSRRRLTISVGTIRGTVAVVIKPVATGWITLGTLRTWQVGNARSRFPTLAFRYRHLAFTHAAGLLPRLLGNAGFAATVTRCQIAIIAVLARLYDTVAAHAHVTNETICQLTHFQLEAIFEALAVEYAGPVDAQVARRTDIRNRPTRGSVDVLVYPASVDLVELRLRFLALVFAAVQGVKFPSTQRLATSLSRLKAKVIAALPKRF
jgi:hypothetical protein